MKGTSLVAVGLVMISAVGRGQTNPTPQALPYVQDFSCTCTLVDNVSGWMPGMESCHFILNLFQDYRPDG